MKKKLLILATSFVVALLLAELGLRIFFGHYITQVYELDPVLLHRVIPATEKRFVHHPINGGHAIRVRINSDGYRGEELRPLGEALRVAVFGDSFVMGEYSELENGFVERLEAELATKLGDEVECVNAGVVAYGPDQSLRRMQADLPKLKPDLALIVLFADNDFGDLMRNKMFRLGDDGSLVAHDFVIGDHLRQKFAAGLGSIALYRAAQKVWRNLRAERAADMMEAGTPAQQRAAAIAEVEKWIDGSAAEYRNYIVNGNPEVRSLFEDHFDADVAVAPDSESAQYKSRLLGAVLGEMAKTAAAQNVPLAVVVVPSPFELCGPRHGGVIDREKHPDYDPAAMTGRIETHAATHGLPSFNLFEPFRAHGADELYFLAPDNHWNEAGQRLAAELVGAFLVERELLKARK